MSIASTTGRISLSTSAAFTWHCTWFFRSLNCEVFSDTWFFRAITWFWWTLTIYIGDVGKWNIIRNIFKLAWHVELHLFYTHPVACQILTVKYCDHTIAIVCQNNLTGSSKVITPEIARTSGLDKQWTGMQSPWPRWICSTITHSTMFSITTLRQDVIKTTIKFTKWARISKINSILKSLRKVSCKSVRLRKTGCSVQMTKTKSCQSTVERFRRQQRATISNKRKSTNSVLNILLLVSWSLPTLVWKYKYSTKIAELYTTFFACGPSKFMYPEIIRDLHKSLFLCSFSTHPVPPQHMDLQYFPTSRVWIFVEL